MARIVIADDDELLSELIIDALMNEGHIVSHCCNGREALAALRFRPPELLILDCNMPEMSGIEVLRIMRGDKALFRIPVLMFTARTSPSDERIARYDGANDYLTKPIMVDELLNRVDDLLAKPVSNAPLSDWVTPSNSSLGFGKRTVT